MSQGFPDSPDDIHQPADDRPPGDSRPLALTPDDRTMGMLAHILGLPTHFLGPLIIWLIKKDQSRFVDDQGKEALNFQLTMLIGHAIGGLTICFTFGALNLILIVLEFVFCIIAAMEANKGVAYRYPLNIRFIK